MLMQEELAHSLKYYDGVCVRHALCLAYIVNTLVDVSYRWRCNSVELYHIGQLFRRPL